jgi:hypothetical protein
MRVEIGAEGQGLLFKAQLHGNYDHAITVIMAMALFCDVRFGALPSLLTSPAWNTREVLSEAAVTTALNRERRLPFATT